MASFDLGVAISYLTFSNANTDTANSQEPSQFDMDAGQATVNVSTEAFAGSERRAQDLTQESTVPDLISPLSLPTTSLPSCSKYSR